MKIALCLFLISTLALAEVVYVEAPTDTDQDGKLDRIYVSVDRPSSDKKLSTIFTISPYALGGTDVPMHAVDSEYLPQDEALKLRTSRGEGFSKTTHGFELAGLAAGRYAAIKAHSLGTGRSTGCPTVGDKSETLAAKAVIDWLNGRAKAFDESGKVVKADWANGKVAMYGTSYDGTLPLMVATTGVEGLKAIVPIAAISNWYDYYRANGLVVNPGGYIGEDADILGYFIVRKNACRDEMKLITQTQGRENGDFTPFWQARNHLADVKNIKAATFIIHGQNDWNVKQKHAIQLWEALEGVAPRRMFLHKGGHGSTYMHEVPKKLQAWLDYHLEGTSGEVANGAAVEVELPNGELMVQKAWPHEDAHSELFYFGQNSKLVTTPEKHAQVTLVDSGKSDDLEELAANPTQRHPGRLAFLSEAFTSPRVISGTAKVSLELAVLNRRAANVTVAIIEVDKAGRTKIVTRGWADPQNHADLIQGELLAPGKSYELVFDLEPKQYKFAAGSRLGVVIASTDKDFTLRPSPGTELQFGLGQKSFIELKLSPEN